MPTLSELGQKLKAKHPGKYDHLSDEEVGRRLKAKHPGKYDEYEDVTLVTNQPDSIAPFPDEFPYTQQAIEQIKAHYTPQRGRFTSWWERGKAEGRNKLLEVLNAEQVAVIKNAAILEQQAMASRERFAQYQTFLTQNAALIHQLKANEKLIERALSKGFTLETNQEVLKETELSRIRVEEHAKIKEVDLDARWKEIQQDSDAADLAQMGDYLVVKKLRKELREAREERHTIKTSKRPKELKEELLADYDEFITRLKAKIDERETGHIPSQNRQAQGGRNSADGGAHYPPEDDEDSV